MSLSSKYKLKLRRQVENPHFLLQDVPVAVATHGGCINHCGLYFVLINTATMIPFSHVLKGNWLLNS